MTIFPEITPERRLELLQPPSGCVDMVLDTDAYNEIDDQFTMVYALLSKVLNVEAVYAAPFHNYRSTGPGDGMEKSYEEILRILHILGIDDRGFAQRGSARAMSSESQPVESAAARDLVERVLARSGQRPLYVVAIGAVTNVASALLMAPQIVDKIVVLAMLGAPRYWPNARCFNLAGDVAAARVVLDSGVPLIRFSGQNVAEQFRTTLPEVERYVKGRGEIGDCLYGLFRDWRYSRLEDHYAASWHIWDIGTVAYLVNPRWIMTDLVPSPILQDDVTWGEVDPARHLIREARHVDRDAVFGDLFVRLTEHSGVWPAQAL